MRISLGSIHQRQGRDGLSFDAVLKVDGKRVGVVENDGNGGCNAYHFDATPGGKRVAGLGGDPTAMRATRDANRAAFEAAAREDAATLGIATDGFEWEDTLISDLMAEIEFGKIAKRDGKKGYAVTAVFLEGFDPDGSRVMGKPMFDDAYTVPLRADTPTIRQSLCDRYPAARIVLYRGDTGERAEVLREAPAAAAWRAERAAATV